MKKIMNRQMQVKALEKICGKFGVDPMVIDLNAEIDSSLSFSENCTRILEEKVKPLIKDGDAERYRITLEDLKAEEIKVFKENEQAKQQHLEELFRITDTRKGDAEKLINELENFAPHTLKVSLCTLMAVNQEVNVINLSEAGIGKTRCTIGLLKLLDLPYTEITGHLAPTDFFNMLKASEGLIVIDESATLLKNNEILNLLLSALWTRRVSWREEVAEVKANIIFNTNSLPDTPFMRALKDRCFFNHVKVDTEQVRDKILSDYEPDRTVLKAIHHNCFYNRSDINDMEYKKLRECVKAMNPKSVREKYKLETMAKFCKNLFGDISFMTRFIGRDAVSAILESDMPRSTKVKAVAMEKGVSVRQAQRIVKENE